MDNVFEAMEVAKEKEDVEAYLKKILPTLGLEQMGENPLLFQGKGIQLTYDPIHHKGTNGFVLNFDDKLELGETIETKEGTLKIVSLFFDGMVGLKGIQEGSPSYDRNQIMTHTEVWRRRNGKTGVDHHENFADQ